GRLWHELRSVSGEHDRIVRLIILERLVKSAVLLALAVSLVTADRLGYLRQLADALQEQLNLAAGHEVIARILTWLLNELGRLLPQVTVVAIAVTAYATLETVEGIGLWLRRRWAE